MGINANLTTVFIINPFVVILSETNNPRIIGML